MKSGTSVLVDDELLARAMTRSGAQTKEAAVEAALRSYVRQPDYAGLLELAGSGVIDDDYDPKALFREESLQVSEPRPGEIARDGPVRRKLPRRW